MSKSVSIHKKAMILREIREKKDILFGPFSDKLKKSEKVKYWKKIHLSSCSLGLVAPDKDWSYTRDVLWQNLRKSTLRKIDIQRKSGSSGEFECKLNVLDNLVIDIIGKESATLMGFGLAETCWSPPNDPSTSKDDDIVMEFLDFPSTSSRAAAATTTPLHAENNNSSSSNGRKIETPEVGEMEKTILSLKKRKLELQNENLLKDSYFKSLQILQLERQLEVPPSQFSDVSVRVPYIMNLSSETATEDPKVNHNRESIRNEVPNGETL